MVSRSTQAREPALTRADVMGCQAACYEWADSYDSKVRGVVRVWRVDTF
jgi:hypothetical protein